MARLSADIDPRILDEAQRLSGARTKRETIDQALREFIARRHAMDLAGCAGTELVEMGVEELLRWRSEGGRAK